VLNYSAMNNSLRKLCIIPVLMMILMAACSLPAEDTASSGNKSAQPSNSNQGPQPAIAQNGSPTITGNANATAAPAPAAQTQPKAEPSDKQSANQPGAKPATKEVAAKAPKLVAPSKTIEFGKQPQATTIVRNFQIRNTGNAELKIESVTPG
jgi:hypothetical protein